MQKCATIPAKIQMERLSWKMHVLFIFVIVFVWSNVLIWSYVDFFLRWAYLCFGWQPLTILDPHTLSRNEYHLNLMYRRPANCKSFMCRQVYEPSALCEQMLAMCNTLLLTCLSFLSLCFCHLIKHLKHVWMLKSTVIELFQKLHTQRTGVFTMFPPHH